MTLSQTAAARRRVALVGTGARAALYIDAISGRFRDDIELVALCDSNPGRLELAGGRVSRAGEAAPRLYSAANFDKLMGECRPQSVLVVTPDATHDDFVVGALDAGSDVVVEKPMATTTVKAQRILDACNRNDRHVRVLFNYRYSPPRTQVKDLLMQEEIGKILSVDFHWMLDTRHGADYFRRWHSGKANSGGLIVHKATHHFDLVNWWLDALPERVFASGQREFYTPQTAERLGLSGHQPRCLGCTKQRDCSFWLDLAADPNLKALYLDNEHHDGYYRDRCVFRPEIEIEDAMHVIVTYNSRATLSYSLNAYCSREGYRIAFNGTEGRLEHEVVEQGYTAGASMAQGAIAADDVRITISPLRGDVREIEPWSGTGGHGGGDDVMLESLFGSPGTDAYGRAADERSGAYAMLVGAAANQCFETGRWVAIRDLVTGLTAP